MKIKQVLKKQDSIKGRLQENIESLIAFKMEFIDQYFPGFKNKVLLQYYPALGEIEECVICMEGMKIEIADDPGMTVCSVTPCFHMFHNDCLKKWFLTSKLCPFCRTQYCETQIIKMKKWINIPIKEKSLQSPQQSSDRLNKNEYVRRMRQKRTNPFTEEISQIDNNTSQTQFVTNSNCSQLDTSHQETNVNITNPRIGMPGRNVLKEIIEEEVKQMNNKI